jgi:hypothetical protein
MSFLQISQSLLIYFQSLDVVDCPELRNLLLFIGAELQDEDIPHRTKMSELISKRFQVELIKEIQVHCLTLG